MKKLPIAFALLLGVFIRLYAGEGVALYKIETPSPSSDNPNRTRIDIALDTNGDGLEDTFIRGLFSTNPADFAMNRRIKEGSIVTFDNEELMLLNGYYVLLGRDVQTIDGKPARPQPNPQQNSGR
jgi:hypothetical protein